MTDTPSQLQDIAFENLPDSLQKAASFAGWTSLMPVQARAIPYILEQRNMMIQARTGSGKTGAFLLPLLEKLNPKHLYYHPNGKEGMMLNIFAKAWASVDHIKPVSAGGKDELDNYVAACWGCNNTLREKTSKNGKPRPISKIENDWDGLSGVYPQLLGTFGAKEDDWSRLIKRSA